MSVKKYGKEEITWFQKVSAHLSKIVKIGQKES